uniref:WW domain-containing protein n=1 Tax=Ciona intestinalis TaxID=7719 RepID=F6WJM1_CIOIN
MDMEENNEPTTQTTFTHHNQIIHVRQDSASELEALFNTVMNPNFKSKSLPMKARNLPKSFFTQPDKPRQQAAYHHGHSQSVGGLVAPNSVSHSRSKSSPASLQLMDIGSLSVKASDIPHDMPLPHGWSAAKTADGQQYYMNHNDRSTTWEDPRIGILKQQRQNQVVMQNQSIATNIHQQQIPLPSGWEQAATPQGEIYFINHQTKSTSWVDPRFQGKKYWLKERNVTENRVSFFPESNFTPEINLCGKSGNQQLCLGRLSPEKHRLKLKRRTHSNSRRDYQEIILRLGITPTNNNNPPNNSQLQQQLMKQLSNPGMENFMGGGNPSFHQRDASLDSGVGMGSNYSLPRTPDGFLNNVEEMETAQPATQQHTHTNNQRFPDFLDTLPASSVDFTSSPVPTSGGQRVCTTSASLDGSELVPSLQDSLPQDFDVESMLNHVKTENMDNGMIWL